MQTYKWKDALRLLKLNGFIKTNGKGSHNKYRYESLDWLSVIVDEGHDISANVYIEIVRVVALKKYILQERISPDDARKDFMLNDVMNKLNKSSVLELFSIEHTKMNLRDKDGRPYKIDNEQNAIKFIESERKRLATLKDNKGVKNHGK